MGKICIGSYVFSITDDDGENHQVTYYFIKPVFFECLCVPDTVKNTMISTVNKTCAVCS